MPATESFAHYYSLGSSFGPTSAYGPASSGTYTITDNRDGTDDNQTAQGDEVTSNVYDTELTYKFIAFTSNNEPILQVSIGGSIILDYVVLSNTNYDSSPGATIGNTVNGAYTYCFAAGTLIATPDGEIAVETLSIGDLVIDQHGNTVPVKWIGRQTVHKLFSGQRMQPVRFRAGALGHGLPHSDLVVTGDHGMMLDGLVINASALVNGNTIDWVPMAELPDQNTYYHVETENHDVILANGAPAETFIDYADRAAFDNHDEYLALYEAERIIPELPHPRISAARHLPAHIAQRLGIETRIDTMFETRAAAS
ncbi:Hint domain-containing protein [Pseudaestuariivita atlantica]|uniref:Hint domain-containing protein n=1 Tax=Pseudaestuariivita atlantica TaxID=1317121 RepID=UPI00067D7C2B|nr:Hint domain-containing protein [Pseudaestuariivita atlantica]